MLRSHDDVLTTNECRRLAVAGAAVSGMPCGAVSVGFPAWVLPLGVGYQGKVKASHSIADYKNAPYLCDSPFDCHMERRYIAGKCGPNYPNTGGIRRGLRLRLGQ